MTETQERILDTAERLIGEHGYAATSLRQIIAEAGVNLAAVHYHFGSKEELLDAVVLRNATPVNQARIAALEKVLAEGGVTVEKVLDAFFAPVGEFAQRKPQFLRLMGRIYAEGLMIPIAAKHFQPTAMKFIAALRQALPHLSEKELIWRVHFMIGAMAHALCGPPVFPGMDDVDGNYTVRMKRLVAFLTGGFEARAPEHGDI